MSAPGDVVVRRYFRGGVLTMAQACVVLGHRPGGTLLGVPVGSDYACRWTDDGHRLREDDVGRLAAAALRTVPWTDRDVVILIREGRAHTVWWLYEQGRFTGWYVNLERPAVPWVASAGTAVRGGWDTVDHALDVLVDPDGTSRWKDEDEFRWGTGRPGFWGPVEARRIRAEGEAVRAAAAAGRSPFDGAPPVPPDGVPARWSGREWRDRPPAVGPTAIAG